VKRNSSRKLLGDPAVVTNVLEEVAASVSLTARVKNPTGNPMQGRDLRLYLFRAFFNDIHRLKRKELTLVSLTRWWRFQTRRGPIRYRN
jgi:hypothetical protein